MTIEKEVQLQAHIIDGEIKLLAYPEDAVLGTLSLNDLIPLEPMNPGTPFTMRVTVFIQTLPRVRKPDYITTIQDRIT
jgi:hypothetical protein